MSLKVSLRVNGNCTVHAEGEDHISLFDQLSRMQEIFGEEKCGKCGATKLKYVVRKVQDGKKEYTYPELRCENFKCRAKLSYGQMEGGLLFPIRFEREEGEYKKDDNGRYIPKGAYGWTIYDKATNTES